jgi:hypothetical protein
MSHVLAVSVRTNAAESTWPMPSVSKISRLAVLASPPPAVRCRKKYGRLRVPAPLYVR